MKRLKLRPDVALDNIKKGIETVQDLHLHFEYEQSGSVQEMERVFKLAFEHFGLYHKVEVLRSGGIGYTYHFLVDGEELRRYHTYAIDDAKIGHANVMGCIEDCIDITLQRKYPRIATDIEPLFYYGFHSKINWNYN